MIATIIIVGIILYFVPTFIAVIGTKRNAAAIFALNLLLGWTALGWIISLIWALAVDVPAPGLDVPPAHRITIEDAPKMLFLGLMAAIAVILIIVIISKMSGNNGATPISTAAVKADKATGTVVAFYDAINRKDFASAWNLLSPAFQNGSGSFDKFRDGYATTQSVRVSVDEVAGNPQKVRAALDATDLIDGNIVHSHFEGWWVLTPSSDGHWLLDDGHFTKTHTDSPTLTEASPADAATSEPSNTLWAPTLGEVDVLGSGATVVACWPTKESLDQANKAMMANDDQGFKQLVAQYDPLSLPAGTRVRVVDGDPFAGHFEVRILSGENENAACWFPPADQYNRAGNFIARRLSSR